MAGTITHYKTGNELYKKLNINVDKDIFLLACQGHDLLYFIKLKDLPKYNKASLLVDKLQDTNFEELVKTFEKEIIKDENIELKSFLYGYIVHHIVDSIFHPFIIYHTGDYKETKETEKYYGKHSLMESVIDALIVDDIHHIYKKFPCFKSSDYLIEKCEEIFNDVYQEANVGKTLVTNMKNVRGFLRVYRVDKTKIKRFGYLTIDKILNKRYEFLSFNYPKKYLEYDLNKKVKWHNPVDNKEHFSCVMDLYKDSLDKAFKAISEIDKSLANKKLAKINLNISANHGYECNKDYELKYFKY